MNKLYFILFFFPIFSFGQEQFFKHLTEKNGLNNNNVYKVIQDTKGYIWFATSSGVVKYDGVNYKNFSTNDGLTDYDIISIYEDNDGRIWFHTFNGVPCFYKNGIIYNPNNHKLLKKVKLTNFISNIFQDHNNTIWISSLSESYSINFNSNSVKLNLNIVGSFFINKNKNTHIFTGIYKYYDVNHKKSYFTKNFSNKKNYSIVGRGGKLKNNSIIYFAEKKIYISNSTSPYFFKEYKVDEIIISLTIYKEFIFVCTKNGVYKYHHDNLKHPIKQILKGKSVTSLMVDHQNNYWFATNKGVYVTGKELTFIDKNVKDVTNISISQNYILSGNIDGHINLFNKKTLRKIKSFKINQKPKKIISYKDEFYISTDNDSYRISLNKKQTFLKNTATKAFLIKNDTLFMGNARGLFFFNKNLVKVKPFKMESIKSKSSFKFIDKERCFTFDIIGDTIFNSSKKYLTKYFKNKVDTLYYAKEAINNRVMGIYFNNDILYLSTNFKGLFLYKNGEKIYHFDETNGLFSNQINNIFFKNNLCYIVTKRGIQFLKENKLHKIDLATLNSFTINKVEVVNDTILLATSSGLLKVNYSNLNTINNEIKSEITLHSKSKPININTKLDYTNNEAKFTFKVFDYKFPITNYSYRLNGLDLIWSETKNNSIEYKNIPPGNYSFQLKYNSKIINEFKFSIKKPIWEEWWFNISLLFTIGVLFYIFYKMSLSLKIDKQQKQHKINLMIARAEQDALKAQMNPHFIFNSLNAIQNLILRNKNNNAYQYLGSFSKLVRSILNNSRELTTTIAKEIQFLELYLKLESLRFSGKFNYVIKISSTIKKEQIIPTMVIQPFVENAILHGLLPLQNKTDAILNINIKEDTFFLYFEIEDNGVGRNNNSKKTRSKESLGLKITEERIILYDQSERSGFTIIDKEKGVKIVLKIIKK